ncbi:MAG: hypothetical protein KBS66_01780 [Eubacterium sp.]|nr:hypothetical protein [Candidatus Colimonas fimequi]
MALFGKKKVSPEEQAAREANKAKLDGFKVTKALGIKKYASAMQFIYDDENKQFVVVEGPEDTFKERDPWVIDYSQVTRVALDVEESWSEEKGEYAPDGYGILLQDKYDEVWWRYEFYAIIETTHPYAGKIRYPMNFKKSIIQVPNHKGIFYRRGLEMNGVYEGEKLDELIAKMEELQLTEPSNLSFKRIMARPVGEKKGLLDMVKQDLKDEYDADKYMKAISNMTVHVKRAKRIREITMGK